MLRGRIWICDQLFNEAIPIVQKMPERKLNRSPILRGACAEPLPDKSNIKLKNATIMEITGALVSGSESHRTLINVDQTGIR